MTSTISAPSASLEPLGAPMPPLQLQPDDWQTLESLAEVARLPADRVSGLRRLAHGQKENRQPGAEEAPVTLLAGCPDNGLERLLSAFTDADTAEVLASEAQGVVVVGPRPQDVQPSLGHWPQRRHTLPGPGHLLSVRLVDPPSSGLEAQLASLGGCAQLLFVTRLGQPLHQGERRLLAALSAHVAAVRVVISAVPGEEIEADEAAEVVAFVERHLKRLGIQAARCLGTVLWWNDGRDGGVEALQDVRPLLDVPADVMREARRAGFHDGLKRLLRDLETRLPDDAPVVELPADERQRLADELRTFLDDLGRQMETLVADDAPTEERLRRILLQRVESWTAHTSVEGHWLRYVDRVRPGSERALLELVEQQASHLRVTLDGFEAPQMALETAPIAPDSTAVNVRAPVTSTWFLVAQRAALAFIGGLAGYVGLAGLLSHLPGPFSQSPTASEVLGAVAFVLAAALTYGLSQRLLRPAEQRSRPASKTPLRAPRLRLAGWSEFRHACLAWFSQIINAPTEAPRQRLAKLLQRLGLPRETFQ